MTETTIETVAATAPVVPLPNSAESWKDAFYSEFNAWGTGIATQAGEWLHTHVTTDSADPGQEQFMDAFGNSVTRYSRNSGDDERVYSWVRDLVEQAVSGPAPAASAAERTTAAAIVDQALPSGDADMLIAGGTSQIRANTIRSILEYQYANWKAGRYLVSTDRLGYRQFTRRLTREHSLSITSNREESAILHAISEMRKVLADPSHDIMSPAPRHDFLERAIGKLNVFAASGSNGAYYAANWLRSEGEGVRRPDVDIDDLRSKGATRLTEYLRGSIVWQPEYDEDVKTVMNEMGVHVYPRPAKPVEVDGSVNNFETLFDWQVSLHPKSSDFQQKAMEYGIRDFTDQAATQGFGDANLTATLRRMVGQYGFTRFTGKEARSLIEGHLAKVVENLKGKGLTPDEWEQRWARRDIAVSYVSGRYGEQNNLCSVLEQATAELGIEPMRKPKHKVRFEGSGVLVEVEVETWHDEGSSLRSEAQTRWNAMTAAQREAAIVERTAPYVNWGDMQAAR